MRKRGWERREDSIAVAPLSFLLTVPRPFGTNFLLFPASAAVNVKRGSYIFHHFHQEDTELSLTKLTHAQQATETASYIFKKSQA